MATELGYKQTSHFETAIAVLACALAACASSACPEGAKEIGGRCVDLAVGDAGIDGSTEMDVFGSSMDPEGMTSGNSGDMMTGTTGGDTSSDSGGSGSMTGGNSSMSNTGGEGDAGIPCVAETESCDGQDNDCDNKIDEDLTARACGSDIGECRAGTQVCSNGEWGTCTGEVTMTTEVCDDADNDCDSTVDEGCPCMAGDSQVCGPSTTVGECKQGTSSCTNGAWAACEGQIESTSELCNDLDDDCDGSTDEMAPCSGSQQCVAGACRECGNDSHCTATAPTCQEYYCELTNYTCTLRPVAANPHTACTGNFGDGVCSNITCVPCIDNSDCNDPNRAYCDNGTSCRPCDGGCGRGKICEEDADCASNNCDATAKVCVEACVGDFTLLNTADYNSLRGCSSISGTLTISENTALGSITLPVLQSAGSITAQCMNKPGLSGLSLPRLMTVTNDLDVDSCPSLTSLDFPMLTSVGDTVFIANHSLLASLDVTSLESIGGQLSVGYVPYLPFPDTRPLWQAASLANQTGTEIGCSLAADTDCANCTGRTCTPMF